MFIMEFLGKMYALWKQVILQICSEQEKNANSFLSFPHLADIIERLTALSPWALSPEPPLWWQQEVVSWPNVCNQQNCSNSLYVVVIQISNAWALRDNKGLHSLQFSGAGHPLLGYGFKLRIGKKEKKWPMIFRLGRLVLEKRTIY